MEEMGKLSAKDGTTYLLESTLHLVGRFYGSEYSVLISTNWMHA